jgi:predicted lipase
MIFDMEEVLDMLKLTIMIYSFGKNIPSKVTTTAELSVIIDKLNLKSFEKNIIKEICETSPRGEILKFIDNEKSGLQAGITISHAKKRVCVVFRGTDSITDWYYNLNIFKTKLNGDKCKVHSGFYNQLNSYNAIYILADKVVETLEEYPKYQLYVTGHSLGAALATLFSYCLTNKIINTIRLVTFGSPRVGNYYWKKSFETSNIVHYRVSNNRDVITAVPFFWFYHVGMSINLEKEFHKYTITNKSKIFNFSLLRRFSVRDHNCCNYYEKIKEFVKDYRHYNYDSVFHNIEGSKGDIKEI